MQTVCTFVFKDTMQPWQRRRLLHKGVEEGVVGVVHIWGHMEPGPWVGTLFCTEKL